MRELRDEREQQVNAAIASLNMTRLIVAHRPETIASASRVIVLNGGKVVFDRPTSALGAGQAGGASGKVPSGAATPDGTTTAPAESQAATGIRPLLSAACAALALFVQPAAQAQWLDIYRTQRLVSDTPAAPLLKNASCIAEVADRPLELEDAILQAVCGNLRARLAWANARAQATAVGVSEAVYLPTINATGGYERDTLSTTHNGAGLGLGPISIHRIRRASTAC